MIVGILTVFFVVLADQISKALIFEFLTQNGPTMFVTSFFNLVTAWNTGVSFSMFNNLGHYGVYILSGFSLTVIAFLMYWMCREKNKLMQVALGFVVGGALGNVIDRVRIGAVFDFLDLHLGTQHWPAFNVADSFICIGALLIIFGNIHLPRKSNASEKK